MLHGAIILGPEIGTLSEEVDASSLLFDEVDEQKESKASILSFSGATASSQHKIIQQLMTKDEFESSIRNLLKFGVQTQLGHTTEEEVHIENLAGLGARKESDLNAEEKAYLKKLFNCLPELMTPDTATMHYLLKGFPVRPIINRPPEYNALATLPIIDTDTAIQAFLKEQKQKHEQDHAATVAEEQNTEAFEPEESAGTNISSMQGKKRQREETSDADLLQSGYRQEVGAGPAAKRARLT